MAKKSRNQKTKYKKRNPAAALLDGLLTLLDRVLEGFAAAVVAVLRGIGWLMAGLLRGLLWLVKRLLLLLAWPLGRLWRLMTGRRNRAQRCLRLTGFEFEEYMAQAAIAASEHVPLAAVQEAYAGAEYYGCDVPAVVCPTMFTASARELAESTGVELWDGERLSHMMRVSGRRPHHDPRRDDEL